MCPDRVGRKGCGPQETFRACADIRIKQGLKHPLQPSLNSHVGTAVPAVPGFHPSPTVSVPVPQVHTSGQVPLSEAQPLSSCSPVGPYIKVPGMADWCNINCRHSPAYCPPSHCACV